MRKYKFLVVLLTLCLVSFAYSSSLKESYIPSKAFKYFPMVVDAIEKIMPDFVPIWYFGALIEHESCIGLLHSRCWDPKSRLKTKREEGAGLGQLTRAYKKNGLIRFDTIERLRRTHPKELSELTWDNVYDRPDLQAKAIGLLWKENYDIIGTKIPDIIERIAMADAAYNGGLKGLYRDRRLCGLKKGCDPKKWFNNVETTCSKSKKILYGNRNACDINRYHVRDVMLTRMDKYKRLFKVLDRIK